MAPELQANILKSHGRRHTAQLFFRFGHGQQPAARLFLEEFAHTEITTAQQQQADTAQTKIDGQQRFVVTLLLSAAGYAYLDVPLDKRPGDARFAGGMKAANADLLDPPVATWDGGYQGAIHGMVLVALGERTRTRLDQHVRAIVKRLRHKSPKGDRLATVLCVEEGDSIQNDDGQDIEHFGYVDGISQPKFFVEEMAGLDTTNWDPLMPISLVLTPDPAGSVDNSFGSYFVFRKLEQNVRGFKEREKQLAKELFGDETSELAGAMAVGRFENGTPVTLSDDDVRIHNIPIPKPDLGKLNNFNYDTDPGQRCPFHSHIRKSTPRGDSVGLGDTLEGEKNRMMARRGIIYGHRFVHPNQAEFEEMPTKGVGLLFMSFQRDLAAQFEFIQRQWVNNAEFSRATPPTGLDPVIGQGPLPDGVQRYATTYGDPASTQAASAFGGFVTLKGGEYLFAPCMCFLRHATSAATQQQMAMQH
ncbi:hypothetical protein BEN49_00880 [Hymenobacter coccineus]|uniref:Peroxidase n=1 Tax=Hymenobacter coccineus TaxID=1908235 RepID=A0A1G1TGD5_9BACT|nr:hypothetical protein BEN49_00880 [Hymenobacter coccineus]